MELLGDVGEVEARFGPRFMHGLHRMYHSQGNLFGHTRWTS
jgi:hypothetical protein